MGTSWSRQVIFVLLCCGTALSPATKNLAEALEPPTESCVSLVFVGDVMLARNLPPHSPYNPTPLDHDYIFELVEPILSAADIAFCNLESPLSGRGKPLNKRYAFNAPPAAVGGLRAASFDIVSLANNHCLDYGDVALADTRRYLYEEGIHSVGITERDTPQTPAIIEAKGLRVGYLAYMCPELYWGEIRRFSPGPAIAHQETVCADVIRLRNDADIIVVSFHWGIEYMHHPTAAQQRLGRAAIDAGAHIIAGHHPHVQQPPEPYNHGIILYSMGNFVFARYVRPPARDTRIYRILADRTGIQSAEYLPCTIVPGRWRPEPQSDSWTLISNTFPCTPAAVTAPEHERPNDKEQTNS